eukprot:CAMPEP_0172785390 /NCGR_PEP_ID=MMETSP1074-20121228/205421_1 /TAXON_ID=2916 /ORGANISM="Ceratium fusus, Strain PA161109" /LENGTH=82 /DNA_ID=CAMNT_0013622397 /DNA_START=624 /DNA_END=876 /DNA_ORIENTATION=+
MTIAVGVGHTWCFGLPRLRLPATYELQSHEDEEADRDHDHNRVTKPVGVTLCVLNGRDGFRGGPVQGHASGVKLDGDMFPES